MHTWASILIALASLGIIVFGFWWGRMLWLHGKGEAKEDRYLPYIIGMTFLVFSITFFAIACGFK